MTKHLKFNYKPVDDYLLVAKFDDKQSNAGLILVNDPDNNIRGEILEVGPGVKLKNKERRQLDVKIGDIIILSKHSAQDVKLEDKWLVLVPESEVLAVVEG